MNVYWNSSGTRISDLLLKTREKILALLHRSSKYITSHAVIYLYKKQIRSIMDAISELDLLNLFMLVLIEFKIIFAELWLIKVS